MPLANNLFGPRLLLTTAAFGLLSLTGCGVDTAALVTATPAASTVSRPIQGHVHGGVYPIQNATVRLLETQSNGYGGAAKALLPPVTTDQYGYFTFPSTSFTCDTGQFAYLTVSSGSTQNLASSVPNNNVLQVGVIGSCATLIADFNTINVFLSEVSTVAAAAALANFISVDSTNASTGQQIVNIAAPAANNAASPSCLGGTSMTCQAAGLAHGFATAYNLVDSVRFDNSFPGGQARSALPSNAQSYVPAQLLNTMGNVLQNCVDSVGGGTAGDSSYCGNLFSLATPPVQGASAPTNTLQAALNMIKYPTNNVSSLYSLQSRTAYFLPDLSGAPTSFAVSIFFGIGPANTYVPFPVDLALDASDNVYVLYGSSGSSSTTTGTGTANTYGAVLGLGADGSQLFQGSQNTSLLYPTQIAVDTNGRLYVSNNDTYTGANGGVFATANGGGSGSLTRIISNANSSGLATDRSDDLWVSVANSTGYSVLEYNNSVLQNATSSLLAATSFASSQLGVPVTSVSIDTQQNVWGVSGGSSTNYAVLVPNSGTLLSPVFNAITGGGFKQSLGNYGGYGLSLSSYSSAFFPTHNQLNGAGYSSSTLASKSSSFSVNNSGAPQRAATDGTGSVFWADSETGGLLYQYKPYQSDSLSSGTLTSLLPCYPFPSGSGSACVTITNSSPVFTPTNLRSLAIDSGGNVWYLAAAGVGTVVETLGFAAPTWPLLAYGHPGCTPGVSTTTPSCP